eukprot:TRINITY_DN4807_c0_g1_i1.p1 TRINITY_DN4807_c0_g1~~TRINITY_DN4807_c0_g1_i1.p1  ORF type:complete len:805 (+),score=184.84 TRINITY_DN4807_c0_g1_i1:243-2417(+)
MPGAEKTASGVEEVLQSTGLRMETSLEQWPVSLFIMGDSESLGLWNPANALKMETTPEIYPRWSAEVRMSSMTQVSYRYILRESLSDRLVWMKRTIFRIVPSGLRMGVFDGDLDPPYSLADPKTGIERMKGEAWIRERRRRQKEPESKDTPPSAAEEDRALHAAKSMKKEHEFVWFGEEYLCKDSMIRISEAWSSVTRLPDCGDDESQSELLHFEPEGVELLNEIGWGDAIVNLRWQYCSQSLPHVWRIGPVWTFLNEIEGKLKCRPSGSSASYIGLPSHSSFSAQSPSNVASQMPHEYVAYFRKQSLDPSHRLHVVCELFVTREIAPTQADQPPVFQTMCIARGVITKKMTPCSEGAIQLLLLSCQEGKGGVVLASVNLQYLIITPFHHPQNDYSKSWMEFVGTTSGASTVHIGHRGMGQSVFRAPVSENTILSFLTASKFSKFVEMDVQLTKDKKLVIYHDFEVPIDLGHGNIVRIPLTSLRSEELLKIGTSSRFLETIKLWSTSMTSRKMRRAKSVDSVWDAMSDSSTTSRPDLTASKPIRPVLEPCATLTETLSAIPRDVSFMLEIKYPSPLAEIQMNIRHIDKNIYVDLILQAVFDHGEDRKIIFCSFNPDVCRLLKMKQFRYPVLFLSGAGFDFGEDFFDPDIDFDDYRCRTVEAAIFFARHADLDGVSLCARSILLRPDVVKMAKEWGLLCFSWGNEKYILPLIPAHSLLVPMHLLC